GNSTSIASGTPVECSRGDAGPVASGAVSMAAMGRTDERAYGRAGVDLDAAARTMDLITREVASTYTPGVLRGLGAFGGLFELPAGMRRPVLAASTDRSEERRVGQEVRTRSIGSTYMITRRV